jgi:hypothetical protein
MASALGTPERRLTLFLATVVDVVSNKLELDDEALKLGKVADTKVVKSWLGDGSFGDVERELFRCIVRDGRAIADYALCDRKRSTKAMKHSS